MTRELITAGPQTPLRAAAEQMRDAKIRHLVVVNALGHLAGLLPQEALLERGGFIDGSWVPVSAEHEGASIAACVRPAVTVEPGHDLLALLRLLLESDDRAIVVVDEARAPVGIFTEYDALKIATTELRADLAVGEVMATELITATPDMSLGEVWEEMRDNEIRHLPIRQGSRLVGVASIRDLLQVGASVAAGGTVAQLIDSARTLETTTPKETVRRAAQRMAEHKIGCLPVLDPSGSLCGLVSATDAIKALLPRGIISGGER